MMERCAPLATAVPQEVPVAEGWTPHAATKLLFLSFRHSQGSPELQRWLFDYVRSDSGQLAFPYCWNKAVKANLRMAIRAYLQIPKGGDSAANYHKRISSKLVNFEVNRSINSLKEALDQAEPVFSHDKIVATITEDILLREIAYCLSPKGRPHEPKISNTLVPSSHGFFSYLRYCAVEQHSTGLAVLDRLYDDIRDYIEHSRNTLELPNHVRDPWLCGREMLDKFDAIVYYHNHDDQQGIQP